MLSFPTPREVVDVTIVLDNDCQVQPHKLAQIIVLNKNNNCIIQKPSCGGSDTVNQGYKDLALTPGRIGTRLHFVE